MVAKGTVAMSLPPMVLFSASHFSVVGQHESPGMHRHKEADSFALAPTKIGRDANNMIGFGVLIADKTQVEGLEEEGCRSLMGERSGRSHTFI